MYLGGFKAFTEGERWKNGGKAFGHHGFATTWTAYKNDVVTTSSSHFESAFDIGLSFHLIEVVWIGEKLGIEFFACVNNSGTYVTCSREEIHNVVQMAHPIDFQFVYFM